MVQEMESRKNIIRLHDVDIFDDRVVVTLSRDKMRQRGGKGGGPARVITVWADAPPARAPPDSVGLRPSYFAMYCPRRMLLQYLYQRGVINTYYDKVQWKPMAPERMQEPLFTAYWLEDDLAKVAPVKYSRFIKWFEEAQIGAGFPAGTFSGKAFRVGGATELALAGASIEQVMQAGGWASSRCAALYLDAPIMPAVEVPIQEDGQ
jgi:hypothetical protein